MKIVEVRIRFGVDEEDSDYKGQKLLDVIKANLEELIIQEGFAGGKIMEVKFVEEEK